MIKYLFLFVLSLAPLFAGQSDAVRYFGATPFRESPFPNPDGIHPITAAAAATRNHFRFEYDTRGRPTRISFQLGDRVRDLADTANLFTLAPITTIQYRDNGEIRQFFDKHGNPVTVRGNVFQEVYTTDKQGFYQSLHFLDINGKRIANSWNIYRYQWTIHGDGTVIEQRFDQSGKPVALRPGFYFYTVKLHYGQHSRLALMQYVDEQGQLLANESGAAQDRIQFTASGDMIAWHVLDTQHRLIRGNGPNVAKGHRRFDAFGNEVHHWFTDEHNKRIPTAYGFWTSRTHFDSHGNMLGRTFTDQHNQKAAHMQAGYTSLKLTWDPSGLNRLRLQYLDTHHQPIAHATRGYAATTGRYDNQHNLLETQFLDTHNHIVNRKDTGVAIIRRTYDQRNRLTRVTFLNKDQQPVNHARLGYATQTRDYRADNAPLPPRYFNATGKEIKESK